MGPQHLMLEADRRALKQVFLNLLSNAVKFTRDGGSVDVHLSRSRGHREDRHQGYRHRHSRGRHRQARPALRAGGEPVLQEPSGQRARARHLPRSGRAAWRRLAHHQPRGPGHDRHLHPARRGRDGRATSPSSPPPPNAAVLTARCARRPRAPLASVSSSVASSVAKSGMSEARASRSFSARGASSGHERLVEAKPQALASARDRAAPPAPGSRRRRATARRPPRAWQSASSVFWSSTSGCSAALDDLQELGDELEIDQPAPHLLQVPDVRRSPFPSSILRPHGPDICGDRARSRGRRQHLPDRRPRSAA